MRGDLGGSSISVQPGTPPFGMYTEIVSIHLIISLILRMRLEIGIVEYVINAVSKAQFGPARGQDVTAAAFHACGEWMTFVSEVTN